MYNLQKYGNNITNTYFKEDKMEASKLKNMVVLKNLPSNIVDEAIIVLKANKKVKKLQKIEKDKLAQEKEEKKDKDYILKEAEMLLNNYISKVDKDSYQKNKETKISKNKYEKIKKYSIITTILCIIQAIIIIF